VKEKPVLHNLESSVLSRHILLVVLAGLLSLGGCDGSDTKKPGPTPTGPIYQLVRVVIPPDSPHRKDKKLADPPDLYVIVQKNGNPIGKKSQRQRGWEAEFAQKPENGYQIDGGNNDTFLVQIWDSQHVSDEMVLVISGLKAKDFDAPILERLTSLDLPEKAGKIEFKRVP
jgi:hypothetical protein